MIPRISSSSPPPRFKKKKSDALLLIRGDNEVEAEGAAVLCFSEALPSISTLKDTVRGGKTQKLGGGGEEMQSAV